MGNHPRNRTGHDADPTSLADAGAAPSWVLRRARRWLLKQVVSIFRSIKNGVTGG